MARKLAELKKQAQVQAAEPACEVREFPLPHSVLVNAQTISATPARNPLAGVPLSGEDTDVVMEDVFERYVIKLLNMQSRRR